jgi:hypothetical protein
MSSVFQFSCQFYFRWMLVVCDSQLNLCEQDLLLQVATEANVNNIGKLESVPAYTRAFFAYSEF